MQSKNTKECSEISSQEQKKLMLDMLKFVDGICRKNNIKYSLIGGSLIGAVRHHGFIPWDDDMDVILTKENYEKLKKILDKEKGRYQTLKNGEGGEYYTFTKLIDKKTQMREGRQRKFLPEYGVFLDLFCYCSTASDAEERKKHCKKIHILAWLMMCGGKSEFHLKTLPRDLVYFCKNMLLTNKVIYGLLQKIFYKTINQYHDSDYVISIFPAYGPQREIQLKKDTDEYIDVKFEDAKVMIFKNYDNILRTTYGDYMKLPPESERTPTHDVKAWWRDGSQKTKGRR